MSDQISRDVLPIPDRPFEGVLPYDARDPDDWSPRVTRAYAKWVNARHNEGSRHDTARHISLELVGLARSRDRSAKPTGAERERQLAGCGAPELAETQPRRPP